MDVFEEVESEVRSYSRYWPTVFSRAEGATLFDETGMGFIDFFAAASSLNYGHNHPVLRDALVRYVSSGGVAQALDMSTVAKREFLEALRDIVLAPRGLDYKVQFAGPGGANAVEAALKLARKVTGRGQVLGFAGGFHGMTAGAQRVSDSSYRRYLGLTASEVRRSIPFDDGLSVVSPELFEQAFREIDVVPDEVAAVILEVVQGEGGVRPAREGWLAALMEFCRANGILVIADDIQAGCGRTGPFFSFERFDIVPDMICLSKSISGYGLPLAMLLIGRPLDLWLPGEHNGTFRGSNLAFVTAKAALDMFWCDRELEAKTELRAGVIEARLLGFATRFPEAVRGISGRGMFWGIALQSGTVASQVREAAFSRGLLIETCGRSGEVLKMLPPLTIKDDELDAGMAALEESIAQVSSFEEDIDDRTLV